METEFEKIREITAEILKIDPDFIGMDSSFEDDLGADSLDLYQIITEVEREFCITLPSEAAEKIVTVRDAAAALAKQM